MHEAIRSTLEPITRYIPHEPYEVLCERGRFVVKRNTALVQEVLEIKERRARLCLNHKGTINGKEF